MSNEELVVVKNLDNEKLNENKSFATGLNFYKLFWIFFIGCFLGVVIETFYCMLQYNTIESRTALVLRTF